MRTALTSACVLALAAVTGWIVATLGFIAPGHAQLFLPAFGACWALFVIALLLLRRTPARAVTALVLAGTAVIGIAALAGPPDTSTDSARYAWDGIVQQHGISPYEYAPADIHLAGLRPSWLFPSPTATDAGTGRVACPGARITPTAQVGASGQICTALNRATVHTIYPPAAELVFLGIREVVPASAQYWPLQAFGLLVVLATTALLLAALRSRGRDPRWAALWGWSPAVMFDGITNSHIDVLGAFLALAATLAVGRRWPARGGLLMGLAIVTKVLPVLVLPPLIRRNPVRVVGAAMLTVAMLYVPYVAASGVGVIGYLPGYLNEEGYDSGSRSALLSAIIPGSATTIVAALLLLALAVVVLARADPYDPWIGQLALVGAALLLASPRYGWYALLLVPFIAMTGRWEWFAVVLSLEVQQTVPNLLTFRITLVLAVVFCLSGTIIRGRQESAGGGPKFLRS